MKFLKNLSKYCLIFIIGIGLALLMAFVEYDNKDLSASVLSLTEQDFFDSTNWDAGYKKENQIFELFLSENVRNEGDIEISILYSPSDFELFVDDINSPFEVDIREENNGNLILGVGGYENADFAEGIFQIPYSGNIKKMNLEYVKSESKVYSIGNLDNIENKKSH